MLVVNIRRNGEVEQLEENTAKIGVLAPSLSFWLQLFNVRKAFIASVISNIFLDTNHTNDYKSKNRNHSLFLHNTKHQK